MQSILNQFPNYKPTLSEKTFWEFDMTALDLEQYAENIVIRVFERGSVDEITDIRLYYGDEKCEKILLNAPYLMENTMYLSKAIFNIYDLNQFKCSTTKQFHQSY